MAIFDDGTDTQDDNQLQNANSNSAAQNPSTQLNAGSGLAGQGGASQAQTSTAAGAPAAPKPSSSGSWTNLTDYLNANADQAPTLGNTLASTVGSSAQAAQGALGQTQQDFQNQYSNVPTADAANSSISSILGDTANDTAGSANVNQYQNMLNNTYTYTNGDGTTSANPYSLQNTVGADGSNDWSKTQSAYDTAANNLSNTQTEQGRDSLLNSQYGTGQAQYNSGEQALDQYLLQGNQQNQDTLSNVYNQYAGGIVPDSTTGTSADLSNSQNTATGYANYVAGNQVAVQTAAQTALQNAISQGTAGVNSELTTAQAGRDSDYQNILSALKSNTLSADQLSQLGLTSGMNLYNIDPSTQLSAEGGALNVNQSATASDYAKAAALQALASGQTYSGTANLGLAAAPDTSTTPAYTYNAAGLSQAAANAQTAMNNELQNNNVVVGSNSGNTNTYSIADLQRQIAAAGNSGTSNASAAFLKFAVPALAAAQAAIYAKYTNTRTLQ